MQLRAISVSPASPELPPECRGPRRWRAADLGDQTAGILWHCDTRDRFSCLMTRDLWHPTRDTWRVLPKTRVRRGGLYQERRRSWRCCGGDGRWRRIRIEDWLHNAHLDTVPSFNTKGDILFPQRRADIDRWLFVIPEFDINFKLVNLTCHPDLFYTNFDTSFTFLKRLVWGRLFEVLTVLMVFEYYLDLSKYHRQFYIKHYLQFYIFTRQP